MYYNLTMRRVRANHCCSAKSIGITYLEYAFVPLGIQHATRMHHTAICVPHRATEFFYSIS